MVFTLLLIQHKMIRKLLAIIESETLDLNENCLKIAMIENKKLGGGRNFT
jgi:hypothetical protein